MAISRLEFTGSPELKQDIESEWMASQQRHAALGSIFVNTVIVVSTYSFLLKFIHSDLIRNAQLPINIDFWFARFMEILMLSMSVRFVRQSGLSRKELGLTLQGWKPAVRNALWISAIVISLLWSLKWASLAYGFDFIGDRQVLSLEYIKWSYPFYIFFAFFQEMIARGVVQGSIEKLLPGRSAGLWAIVATSAIFGLLHTHSAAHVTIAAVMSSVLWGLMYRKDRTLAGVTVSHFLIGNFAELLGFWR